MDLLESTALAFVLLVSGGVARWCYEVHRSRLVEWWSEFIQDGGTVPDQEKEEDPIQSEIKRLEKEYEQSLREVEELQTQIRQEKCLHMQTLEIHHKGSRVVRLFCQDCGLELEGESRC